MYKIIRFYKSGKKKTIKTVPTLELAQLHCRDPRTQKAGVWFDGYTKVGKNPHIRKGAMKNPVFAYCSRCHKYHKRGSKIFEAHKPYLGMYIDTKTGSRRRTVPKHIRDYHEMRRRGELNPMSRRKRRSKSNLAPVLGVVAIAAVIYFVTRK